MAVARHWCEYMHTLARKEECLMMRLFFPMRIPGFAAPIGRQLPEALNLSGRPLGNSQGNTPKTVTAQAYDKLVPK